MKLLIILLCKGTNAPVVPHFKGQFCNAHVMHPRSSVSGFNLETNYMRAQIGAERSSALKRH